jgi:hypothetical protein
MEILALLVVEKDMVEFVDGGEVMGAEEGHISLLLIAALGRIHH